MERQRDRALADRFRDRELALGEPVPLTVERLQVDAREIIRCPNVVPAHAVDDPVPFLTREFVPQSDDEHEPAHAGLGVHGREDEVRVVEETGHVLLGDLVAACHDLLEPLHLRKTERRLQLAHPVVVAQPLVREPGAGLRAALPRSPALIPE